MLKLENIEMTFNPGTMYEKRVLKGINLDIHRGDFITVIGSNGAGKSTLYDIIAGTKKPTGGKILLNVEDSGAGATGTGGDGGVPRDAGGVPRTEGAGDGASESDEGRWQDITHEAEWKRSRFIGRIFQNPRLGTAGKMKLEDNMMICYKKGPKGLRISLNAKMRSYFREQLKILNMGLENRLKDNVELFSGGQRQALTLLMAVMSKPSLLLLDEHTAALDPTNAEIIMELTRSFAEQYNLTVMMVTHNMQHALQYGNRLLMMDAGNIILDISGEEKANLTMDELIRRFRDIKKNGIVNDQMLLQ